MHGNTFEWCRDWYHARLPGGVDPDLHEARPDGAEPDGSLSRVAPGRRMDRRRLALPVGLPATIRAGTAYDHIGFRVVAVRP